MPFRLDDHEDKGHLILLKGPKNTNSMNGSWTGLNMVKANLLKDKEFEDMVHVTTIDVTEWNQLSHEKKIRHIHDILHKGRVALNQKRGE